MSETNSLSDDQSLHEREDELENGMNDMIANIRKLDNQSVDGQSQYDYQIPRESIYANQFNVSTKMQNFEKYSFPTTDSSKRPMISSQVLDLNQMQELESISEELYEEEEIYPQHEGYYSDSSESSLDYKWSNWSDLTMSSNLPVIDCQTNQIQSNCMLTGHEDKDQDFEGSSDSISSFGSDFDSILNYSLKSKLDIDDYCDDNETLRTACDSVERYSLNSKVVQKESISLFESEASVSDFVEIISDSDEFFKTLNQNYEPNKKFEQTLDQLSSSTTSTESTPLSPSMISRISKVTTDSGDSNSELSSDAISGQKSVQSAEELSSHSWTS